MERLNIEIIPAIDLRGGRGVRLYQGDYGQETVFSDDPLDVALNWQSMGAPRLHVVDLDGAASGEISNLDIIKELAIAMLVPVQLGGGIRQMETIEQLLKAGIERIILGTAAVKDPELVKEACRRFRESIIVGIDAREGWIAIQGWQQETRLEAIEFAKMGLVPGGTYRNKEFRSKMVEIAGDIPNYIQDILFDPQTSGGLLISVSATKAELLLTRLHEAGVPEAAIIGEVVGQPTGRIVIK